MNAKSFCLFVLILSCFSCVSNDEIVEPTDITTEFSSEEFRVLNDYSLFITKGIYNYAYDEKYGNIDYESAVNVMLSYGFDNFDINLSAYFDQPYTRVVDNLDEMMKEQLTENQYLLLKDVLLKDRIEDDDLKDLRVKASLLTPSEQEIIFYILDASEAITAGIMDGINMSIPNVTRAAKHSFGCNVAASTIGSVCGFLAGALCAVATPIVGTVVGSVVSTVVGAYISTKAC